LHGVMHGTDTLKSSFVHYHYKHTVVGGIWVLACIKHFAEYSSFSVVLC
jgi:hypothetical protein